MSSPEIRADAGGPAPAAPARWRRLVRALAPWLITVAAFVAILRRYPPGEVLAAMGEGKVAPMMAIGFALGVALLPFAAAWDRVVMRATVPASAHPPTYRDALRGKGGSAVLMVLGYAFGSGGYGVWIARATGCGARVAAGIVLYIMASDLGAVALVATPCVWLGGLHAPWLAIGAPVVGLLVLGLALLGPRLGRKRRDRDDVLAPWRRAGPGAALISVFGRGVNVALIMVMTWLGARAFGLGIPASGMATYLPIILLVSALPVNIAGLGPATAVWVLAFERWAPGERIVAFQFLWQLAFGMGVVVRGLPFVRRVIAEIDEGRAGTAAD
jgi:hypothetical protein